MKNNLKLYLVLGKDYSENEREIYVIATNAGEAEQKADKFWGEDYSFKSSTIKLIAIANEQSDREHIFTIID